MQLLERYYHDLRKMVVQTMWDEIVPMDITPAAKWFLQESPQEYWRYREDFPCVMPPAPITWMEFEVPPYIRSADREIRNNATRASGAVILTMEIPADEREEMVARDGLVDAFNAMLAHANIVAGWAKKDKKRFDTLAEYKAQDVHPRWLMFWQLFAEPIGNRGIYPYLSYAFYMDEGGQILGDLGLGNLKLIPGITPPPNEHAFADSLPYLFALSLTHCRNVEVRDRVVSPAVQRKRSKERGIPALRFKQLVIKPVGGKQPMASKAAGGIQPIHFVRAHFKTFTEDRKLFGRHTGTYFWHMQARGNKSAGEIVKHYKVTPETEQTHA